MIDNILSKIINREVQSEEVALLLSGGIDSLSVAFACDRLGKKVNGYTFHLQNEPSYDSEKAKEAAQTFNWNITTIEVPTDNLENDFFTLLNKYECKKKTHWECVFPFMYVYPKIKEEYVLSGWAADGYYGVSKKANIHYKHTQQLFDKFRDDYFRPDMQAGYKWHKKVADQYNKKLITPYLTDDVKNFFYSKSWEELNKPEQKIHVRKAYKKELKKIKVKPHLNLQKVGKVDILFERLLENKKINFKRRSRMMDVYKDWSMLNSNATLEEFL